MCLKGCLALQEMEILGVVVSSVAAKSSLKIQRAQHVAKACLLFRFFFFLFLIKTCSSLFSNEPKRFRGKKEESSFCLKIVEAESTFQKILLAMPRELLSLSCEMENLK